MNCRTVWRDGLDLRLLWCVARVGPGVIFFPLVSPDLYQLAVAVSVILWCVAFALFLFVYMPVLIYPRVDGRPSVL